MKNSKIRQLFFCFIILLIGVNRSFANLESPVSVEPAENIKAMFIIRFAGLIEWPPHSSVQKERTPFVIGVLGDPPVATALTLLTRERKILGKKTEILLLSEFDSNRVKQCNVLFISERSRKKIIKILDFIGNLPILTIGDADNYEKRGVIINFVQNQSKRMKFDVNLQAAKKSGIKLTSQVVRRAKTIIR